MPYEMLEFLSFQKFFVKIFGIQGTQWRAAGTIYLHLESLFEGSQMVAT